MNYWSRWIRSHNVTTVTFAVRRCWPLIHMSHVAWCVGEGTWVGCEKKPAETMSPLDIVRLSRARGGRVYSPPRGMTTRCGDAAFCQIYLDTGFSCIFNLRKIHSFLVVKVGHKAVTFFRIFSHCGKRIKRLNKLARSASGWEAIIAV